MALFVSTADEPASIVAQFDFSTVLRAIGWAWSWRRRMDAGEYATIQELAETVGLVERHVSRKLRLPDLAPEVLKRPTCGREASVVSLYDLCLLAGGVEGTDGAGSWRMSCRSTR